MERLVPGGPGCVCSECFKKGRKQNVLPFAVEGHEPKQRWPVVNWQGDVARIRPSHKSHPNLITNRKRQMARNDRSEAYSALHCLARRIFHAGFWRAPFLRLSCLIIEQIAVKKFLALFIAQRVAGHDVRGALQTFYDGRMGHYGVQKVGIG